MNYNKVDEKIVEKLKSIVGAENVILDKEALENYAHDETPFYKSMPEAAVKPNSTDEVSKIMKLAYEGNLPVTPRGGGTCLSAGAVPIYGGIVLSLERMNRIKEIDKNNLMVVVEPGIINEQLGKELAEHNLFFPPDPVSLDSCTIGGNIAENAGGPRAMKYGVTKNYVTGLEVVFPDGTITKIGGKLLKNVTGYDLLDLIVGSEGTLAIVTEATLRVLPLPIIIIDLLIPFKCVEDACAFAIALLRENIATVAIEFMDGGSYQMVGKHLKRKLPFTEAGAHVIVELNGNFDDEVRKSYDKVGNVALKFGALDVFVAESERDKEKIWEPRKKIGDALKALTKIIAREDLVVPKDQIPALLVKLDECAKRYDAKVFAFGHLGDGNIHADFGLLDYGDAKKDYSDNPPKADLDYADRRTADYTDMKWVENMRKEVYEITVSLGGTITAEHGIGLSKKQYLSMALDKMQIEIMKRIKGIFDPKNILNPGKIFDYTDE